MQLTFFQTFTPPAPAPGVVPQAVARGTRVPVRVLVRNVGGTLVFLAGTTDDAIGPDGLPSSATYRLPPGAADVFIMAPGQTLFAVGAAVGGTIVVSISEAIPIGQGVV